MRVAIRLIAATAMAFCVASCASTTGGERGWKSLFDGRTLDGWTPKIRGYPLGENYADTFSVQDGAIRVSYGKYDRFAERFGHLFYRTPFKAYRFRMEYRFLTEGTPADTPGWAQANSGVMIFSQDPTTMAVGASFPVSIEAQLLGPAAEGPRTNGNMCSPGTHVVMNGELITKHCINSTTPAQPNGQWITFEIDVPAQGDIVQKVNGVETIRYSRPQLDPAGGMADSKPLVAAAGGKVELDGGYISLQSEGAPIEFRKIEVMELN